MRLPRPRLLLALSVLLPLAACGQLEQLSTEQALERLNVATTKVYDADGHVIADLHGEVNREIVPLRAIPKHLRDAVVAIEDERFFTHQGVDLRSILRAAASNAESGGRAGVQGGSTISQQLAKNLYFPRPARTIARKIAEARVTVQLERQYTKDEILEMYLNTIYLGRGMYGVEAASRSYFGRSVSKLDLARAAFLAGLIHEPARYEWSSTDPSARRRSRQEAARERRNLVLSQMRRLGFVSRTQAEAARDEPVEVRPYEPTRWRHPYYVDYVLRTLGVLRNSRSDRLDPRFDFLGRTFDERSASVYRGGLRVYTALDPHAQDAAERAIPDVLKDAPDRLSGALVAIEPSNGYVRALVGGKDYYPSCGGTSPPPTCRLAKVNLALGNYGGGSGRQPGSSFKPFVLATALQRGISLAQAYPSDTFSYTYPGGVWNVSNYDGSGSGNMDLVSATQHSVNAVFARLEIEGVGDGDGLAGAARVAGVARRLGIGFPTPDELRARCGADYSRTDACLAADDTPAIALGAKEVSPFDMAGAYATFANDGVRVEPTAIVRITDAKGKVLYRADPERRRVLPAGVARAVTYVLQQVVGGGTATRAAIDRPAAAKTGTSQAWRDAWLAGYVPQLAAVVWVGNPIPLPGAGVESMTPANGYPVRVVGGTLPAAIWHGFMTGALEGIPERDFAEPPEAVFHAGIPPSPGASVPPGPVEPGAVPPVVDELYGIARLRIERAGYSASLQESCAPSGDVRLHRVWAQDPSAGTVGQPGDLVTVWYQPGGCD